MLRHTVLGFAVGVALGFPALAQVTGRPQPSPTAPPYPTTTISDGFKIAATGDLLGLYRPGALAQDPQLAKVVTILRDADATFANLEGNIFDIRSFVGAPAAENGGFEAGQGGPGGGPLHEASVTNDFKELGINLISTANNHALDWGEAGLWATMKTLDDAKIVHAGTGRNLTEARAAAFLETKRGLVALIGAASTFLPMAPAGASSRDLAGRPGISALRNKPITLVTRAEFDVLRGIAARQGMGVGADATEVTIKPNDATLTGQTFRVAEQPGLTYTVNPEDREGILRAIRAGKQAAALAVFSIHAHESESGGQEYQVPGDTLTSPQFLVDILHDAVDAGADVVIVHGPHTLRGIEIYKGKPIFYGMGSFFFQLGQLGIDWPKDWYDSAVAVTEFQGGKPSTVRIYPLDLGLPAESRPRNRQGIPELAKPTDAIRILQELQRSSERYGTKIAIENNVGVIHVGAG